MTSEKTPDYYLASGLGEVDEIVYRALGPSSGSALALYHFYLVSNFKYRMRAGLKSTDEKSILREIDKSTHSIEKMRHWDEVFKKDLRDANQKRNDPPEDNHCASDSHRTMRWDSQASLVAHIFANALQRGVFNDEEADIIASCLNAFYNDGQSNKGRSHELDQVIRTISTSDLGIEDLVRIERVVQSAIGRVQGNPVG